MSDCKIICSKASTCKAAEGCDHAKPHKGPCGPYTQCHSDPDGDISGCITVGSELNFKKHPSDVIKDHEETIAKQADKIKSLELFIENLLSKQYKYSPVMQGGGVKYYKISEYTFTEAKNILDKSCD
ncbi:hypothetical protein VPAG_00053 [Vibrio phage douglas 12A4]|uniref:hypothetical protein n=1 Tax=Vibrio phage douglas 12A4 TaxID=573171 RepID=UPI0002C10665|nr:hypothetical protein VPAG_00053 [Vibrio phage douglas 12A4]AGG58089.1 hypothetical protein VPAG_00053 [Vibrio phage douglas 12A4]